MVRVLGAGLWVFLLLSGQAIAHAIIVDSVPAPFAHVPAGQLDVALRYNSRIDAGRSKLLLKHGDIMERVAVSEAATPDVLAARVQVAAGAYELRWQVLATDGHVTRGRVPFTVDTAPRVGAVLQAGASAQAGPTK